MEGHCSTGQSPQLSVVPMEEEEEICSYRRFATNFGSHFNGQADQEEGLFAGCQETSASNN